MKDNDTRDELIAGLPRELIMPLLAGIAKKMLGEYAKEMQPGHEIPPGLTGGSPKTFAHLYSALLHGYIHEEGHARMMLHLNPSAAPMVRMIVEPTISDDGAGVQITGGACGTREDFTDTREHIMVSVAGWLAETRALAIASRSKNPGTTLFKQMNADSATAMWIMPDFAKAFDGCSSDSAEMRKACRAWLPDDGPDPENEDDEERVQAVIAAVREKLVDAMSAAFRVIDAQALDLIQAATHNANRHFGVIINAMIAMGPHINRMRAACVGAFTDAEMEALTDDDLGKPANVWNK